MPDNVWLGVTVEEEIYYKKRIYYLNQTKAKLKFISFEPIMEYITLNLNPQNWIIIGRLTQYGKKYQPKKWWIEDIVNRARFYNIPIFLKDNLKEIWGEPLIQEFPE